MADCECLATCLFFNDEMENMPAVAGMLKANYCRGDSSRCARHMVFEKLGRDAVPTDLYPSDTGRAAKIVGS